MPLDFFKKLGKLLSPAELTRFFQDKFYPKDKSRVQKIRDRITGLESPEKLMQLIMSELSVTELVPDLGKYYTFIYTAKTPNIIYDQHPLIVLVKFQEGGFMGYNYHWNNYRNYGWDEIRSSLHVVYPYELDDIKSLPYARFKKTR